MTKHLSSEATFIYAVMAKNMNKLKQQYLQSEADEKTKTAMFGRANPVPQQLRMGDVVKYYRQGTQNINSWRGPAKIIGLDWTIGKNCKSNDDKWKRKL